MQRQSARRLSEQHGHVPAQREQRAPDLREGVHAEDRKTHAGVAERRGDDEPGDAEPGGEVSHQKLKQRGQREIADDQQRARGDHHDHVALERDLEQAFEYQRHRQHDDEEDGEQRCKLARQRDDRIAAGAGEPGAHAAAAELGADRIAGGERDHRMDDHRKQRTQQELGIVPLRVHQHDGFGDQRPDLRGRRCRQARRRCLARGSGERVAHALRRNAGGGEELLVVEGDDLRAPTGLEIAFEIGRDVDGRDGGARSYRARRRREIAGTRDDAQAGSRRHLLHERARGVRPVVVHDNHPQPPDHRMAEHQAKHDEGEQRHAEDQDERDPVVQQPAQLAPGDEAESGLGPRPHGCCCQSMYALMPGRSSGTCSTG